MNGFMDIQEDQWEASELKKKVHADELRQQMEEKRLRDQANK
jgi:hypothetical protein